MATAALAGFGAPVVATAEVSTTPVLRLLVVGVPAVVPLVAQWWGIKPWIDDKKGLPLYWPAPAQPPPPVPLGVAKASSVSQRSEGTFQVEVSLAPGVQLEATPRAGWNVPVKTMSTEVRTLTEVVHFQGQVAMTAHVPQKMPEIVEHDVLDAQTGAALVPSVSSSGVVAVARAAVGYVIVVYEAQVVTLEAAFGLVSAPWNDATRERVLRELVFSGEAREVPLLMLQVKGYDPELRKTQSEMVQTNMALMGFLHQFGGTNFEEDEDDAQEQAYTETGRTTQTVRVTSKTDATAWIDVEVASQVVMTKGDGQTMVLNFKVPTS